MGKALLASLILCAILCPTPCRASRISLEISTEVVRTEKGWSARVRVLNKGDEAAHDLQVRLQAVGEDTSSAIVGELGAGKVWEIELPILAAAKSPSPAIRGRYPVVTRVFYSDANGHPFSALSVGHFDAGEAAVSQLGGSLRVSAVSDKGTFSLDLRNMEQTPIEATVSWVFPREVVPDRETDRITIQGRGSARLEGTLKNLSALPGSAYPVFALMEYDKDGVHFTAKAGATLEVTEAQSLVGPWRIPLLVLLVVLGIVIVVRQYAHRRPPAGSPD